MINIDICTNIYRPVTQVFEFVSTPESDFQWQYGTLESARLSDSLGGVGAFFRSVGHLMGYRFQATFEVTEYEQNRKYAFKSLSGPLNLLTTYTFEIAAGSTRINVSTQAAVIAFPQVSERILEKKMKRQLKDSLALLKEVLETRRMEPALRAGSAASLNTD